MSKSKYINLNSEERTQKILKCEMLLETEQSLEQRARILLDLGDLFAAGQDFESAVASYDKAIQIEPDDHTTWYNRGIALRNLGRHEEAVASYDKAIQIEPDDHTTWYNRGIALRNLGRHEEAVASY
ncbi:tetratricopeptide repeat protein, partial [Nostoc sp.]